jgi:uncharacterized protein YbjQ (UPF0145 family)
MDLIIFSCLILTGYFVGKYRENAHYRSIHFREKASEHIPVITLSEKHIPQSMETLGLATGSAVIAVDYYKSFLSTLRMIFGGEMKSYSSLIDRARREAILRMKASHPDADMFINCRIETSSISKGQKKSVSAVEVMAFSTAVTVSNEIRTEAS